MILVPAPLDPPANRLLAALASEGTPMTGDARRLEGAAAVTLVLSSAPALPDVAGLVASLGVRPVRALVLSRLGAHLDARHTSLQQLWRLEEAARAAIPATLTLRFAPLLGAGTPLWNKLRSRPSLPRGGRQMLNPVAERDALETLRRALDGRAAWGGWFEVAGPEVVTLAELRDLAAQAGPGPDAGAWEPSLDEMAEHRLAESEPWAMHFGLTPASPVDAVREVVA